MDFKSLATLTAPSETDLMAVGKNAVEIVDCLTIDSPAMLEAAAEELRSIKAKRNDIESKRKSIVDPINKAKDAIQALFNPALALLDQAEAKLKRAIGAYQDEQRRIAVEAQRKADEEAARERARLQAEAAAAEAKAREQADELRRKSEEAAAAGNAEKAAKLASQAASKEEIGIEKAQTIQAEAAATVAPVVRSGPAKVEGISGRDNWKAEVIDVKALVQHIIANRPDLISLIEIKASGINQLAKAQKSALVLPGVRVYNDKIISARAA